MKRYGDYERIDDESLITDPLETKLNAFFKRVIEFMKETECDSSSIELRIHKTDEGQFIYCKWMGKDIT